MGADQTAIPTLEPSGWWLPSDDRYFAQFISGPAPKRNGFMRGHLLEAFRHVRKWDVAVDCGAHCGFWSWDMAPRFRELYAFEPTPVTYECLLKNLEPYTNVHAYNLALGAEPSRGVIRNDRAKLSNKNTGSNYVAMDPAGDVEIVTLDSFDLPGCDLLKIDVEGFELRVLEGARRLIKRFRPVISMECTDRKFRGRYDIEEGAAEHWLLNRGYRVVWAERPDKVFVPA